jgi:hypothetical protein
MFTSLHLEMEVNRILDHPITSDELKRMGTPLFLKKDFKSVPVSSCCGHPPGGIAGGYGSAKIAAIPPR